MSSNDDDADQDEKSKRRRRQASSSSSSSAANNRVKSRSHDDNSSSASSVKARRRTARAETATNKRIKKKMDAGGNGRLAASDDENAQSPVELDEFDRTTTSIGFDIRNLVTKKELTNSPRKPIKLTINTKSRVQVPAAYGAPKPRRKRPVQLSPNPEDRLSSVSPCDLPSDDEEKLTAATAVGGRTVELEDISPQGSSDEDEEPDGRRSENSNQSEDRRRSY
uniref:Uncharacterized protein n=1 Tax=Romanomermis culicivorax TaxID=13658 RepID=A0A915JCT8_ROMCU